MDITNTKPVPIKISKNYWSSKAPISPLKQWRHDGDPDPNLSPVSPSRPFTEYLSEVELQDPLNWSPTWDKTLGLFGMNGRNRGAASELLEVEGYTQEGIVKGKKLTKSEAVKGNAKPWKSGHKHNGAIDLSQVARSQIVNRRHKYSGAVDSSATTRDGIVKGARGPRSDLVGQVPRTLRKYSETVDFGGAPAPGLKVHARDIQAGLAEAMNSSPKPEPRAPRQQLQPHPRPHPRLQPHPQPNPQPNTTTQTYTLCPIPPPATMQNKPSDNLVRDHPSENDDTDNEYWDDGHDKMQHPTKPSPSSQQRNITSKGPRPHLPASNNPKGTIMRGSTADDWLDLKDEFGDKAVSRKKTQIHTRMADRTIYPKPMADPNKPKLPLPEAKNGATGLDKPREPKPLSRVVWNFVTGSNRPPVEASDAAGKKIVGNWEKVSLLKTGVWPLASSGQLPAEKEANKARPALTKKKLEEMALNKRKEEIVPKNKKEVANNTALEDASSSESEEEIAVKVQKPAPTKKVAKPIKTKTSKKPKMEDLSSSESELVEVMVKGVKVMRTKCWMTKERKLARMQIPEASNDEDYEEQYAARKQHLEELARAYEAKVKGERPTTCSISKPGEPITSGLCTENIPEKPRRPMKNCAV
jgi:hypothetical protein